MTNEFEQNVKTMETILNFEKRGHIIVDSPVLTKKRTAEGRFLAWTIVIVTILMAISLICHKAGLNDWLTFGKGLVVVCVASFIFIKGMNWLLDNTYTAIDGKVKRLLPATVYANKDARTLVTFLAFYGKQGDAINAFMGDEKLVKALKDFDKVNDSKEIEILIKNDCQKLYAKDGKDALAYAKSKVEMGHSVHLKHVILVGQN